MTIPNISTQSTDAWPSSKAVRQSFLDFFVEKEHHIVRSAPVVPHGDPSLLFANAGMNQFKDIFLGKGSRDYQRAANSQKCIRVSGKHNDLEDVGHDNYHHTFFEMLGNWSFGDYFKETAIAYAWELLVDRWGLDQTRIYATVFGGDTQDGLEPDEESSMLWAQLTGLPAERIQAFSKKDNFWEMGSTGPCGPCSEIHYDLGAEVYCPSCEKKGQQCGVNVDGCWRFIELWNLVFIQYNRNADQSLEPLPAKHVDTGMGLERIVRVLQGKTSNYDSDLFLPLIEAVIDFSGNPCAKPLEGVAARVIADHIRTLSFSIADGVLPSNEGRGYVLRRILRRAARFGKVLQLERPFLSDLVPILVDKMGQAYPELIEQQGHVQRVIQAEEQSFVQTLHRGTELFEKMAEQLVAQQQTMLSGKDAFKLYDTFGFPMDLTMLMAREKGLSVDEQGFKTAMAQQQAQSRENVNEHGVDQPWQEISSGEHSEFLGYTQFEVQTSVCQLRQLEAQVWQVVLAETPFYAEGGGQIADRGWITALDATPQEGSSSNNNGNSNTGNGSERSSNAGSACWEVIDVQKEGDWIIHTCSGTSTPPAMVRAEVNGERRACITRNHTATHLLHAALRKVLGTHVHQAGSIVHADYLRFDYTHFERPSREQLLLIEQTMNAAVRQNVTLQIFETSYQEAIDQGILALFGEKYGDRVRVVKAKEVSTELCGGCHVNATGDIGLVKIVSESALAAGVRRVVAHSGSGAEGYVSTMMQMVEDARRVLNIDAEQLNQRIETLLQENRTLKKTLEAAQKTQVMSHSTQGGSEPTWESIEGQGLGNNEKIAVLSQHVPATSLKAFRQYADGFRQQYPDAVVVLSATLDDEGKLLCVVPEKWIKHGLHAGKLMQALTALGGGKGGGPSHLANGGIKDHEQARNVVKETKQIVIEQLQSNA